MAHDSWSDIGALLDGAFETFRKRLGDIEEHLKEIDGRLDAFMEVSPSPHERQQWCRINFSGLAAEIHKHLPGERSRRDYETILAAVHAAFNPREMP